jgi:hypothetical protein
VTSVDPRVTSTSPSLTATSEAKVPWPQPKRREHLPSLVAIVVDRLLAKDNSKGSSASATAPKLGGGDWFDRLLYLDMNAAISAIESPLRIVSATCAGPIDTMITSLAAPFSLRRRLPQRQFRRKGSSTFDVGEIDARAVGLYLILTLKSTTRLTATRIFMNEL